MVNVEANESVQFDLNTVEGTQGLYDSIMGSSEETVEPSDTDHDGDDKGSSNVDVKGEDQTTGEGEFVLKHPDFEGGERRFTKDKVTEYAQKGFDYESKMQRYKTDIKSFEEQRKEFESQQSEFNEKFEYYQHIDSYIHENPAFGELLKRSWEAEQGNNYKPYNPEVEALKEKLSSFEKAFSEREQQEQEKRQQELSSALDKSIEDYKGKYSDFDWKGKDEFGRTLQERIEDFAVENKFPSFVAAANAMLFDKIVQHEALKAKEKVTKSIQVQNKKGLGPVTSMPTMGNQKEINSPKDFSKLSWQELTKMAVREAGG